MIRAALPLAAALAAGTLGSVYRTGPPPGHTGAFGEPDCGVCHFDADRDTDAGALTILAPATYRPGDPVELRVELRDPELAAAGFQLTTRFVDGPAAGRQAGSLEPASVRTRVEAGEAGVSYASHTDIGARHDGPGPATWTVRWRAPTDGGAVAVDVAAQAANDDDSEFGERLYRADTRAAPRSD